MFALVLAALTDTAPNPAPLPTMSPNAIYERAISTMRALAKPPAATYHGVLTESGLTMSCNATGLDFSGFSRRSYTYEYEAHFRAPNAAKASGTVDGKSCASDGVLTPFFDFTDGSKRSATTPPPDPSGGLQVIATVRSVSRDYDATLLGIESYKGHEVYHLGLRARRDPDDNILTSMLVETHSFRVRELEANAHESDFGIAARVHVDVTFDDYGAYFLADHMNVDVALAAVIFFRKHIGITIDNSNFTFDP